MIADRPVEQLGTVIPTMSTETIERDEGEPNVDVVESAKSFVDVLRDSAAVDRVYGDSIDIDGKTIIPVARVAYGFGGGFGSSRESTEEAGQGGGGGGGMKAVPVGVVEITDAETRFVRFTAWKRLALAAGVGVVLGILLGRR